MNDIQNKDAMEFLSEIRSDYVDLLLTDIPYNGVNRKSNGLRNLDKGDADVLNISLQELIPEMIRVTKGSGYIFCGWEQISEIIKIVREAKLSNRLCVWRKTNPSPMNGQSIWLSGAEFCVYFKKKNATFNEHCKNCVWDFPCGRGKVHPTEKPLKLFEYLVKTSSNEGDVVCDPFVGSGTTAVASMALNRSYLCNDISSEYCELAKTRLGNCNLLLSDY
jgi:DNA modification methylase